MRYPNKLNLKQKIKPNLPTLVQDYLNQNESLSSFYDFAPSLKGLKEAYSKRSKFPVNREVLVETLLEQAGQSGFATEITNSQILRLRNPKVMTVTTGHQLCVYGGPMFFMYKILSVIGLSRKLEAEGMEVVPVYWMASEDHDFDEINHVHLKGEKITWNTNQSGAVGSISIIDLDEFKHHLKHQFSNDYRYDDTLNQLDIIFNSSKTLSQAIQDFVYWVFAQEGIVVIDPNVRGLKEEFKRVARSELTDQISSIQLTKSNESLQEKGYPVQVNGRSINLFWLDDNYRERIEWNGATFETPDKKNQWELGELLRLVDNAPEHFSPNVILRPVYQEMILPNLAYIGGPGETSYWLQLKSVFKAFGVFMPVVLMRDMFLLVNDTLDKKIEKLGIEYSDLLKNQDWLFTELVKRKGSNEFIIEEIREPISKALQHAIDQIDEVDVTLSQSAKTETVRILMRLNVLQSKLLRSDKRKSEELQQRLQSLFSEVYQNGTPQERLDNWLNHFQNPKQIIEFLEWIDPLASDRLKVVSHKA